MACGAGVAERGARVREEEEGGEGEARVDGDRRRSEAVALNGLSLACWWRIAGSVNLVTTLILHVSFVGDALPRADKVFSIHFHSLILVAL